MKVAVKVPSPTKIFAIFVEDSTMPGKSVSILCTPLMHASRAPMTPSWISSGMTVFGRSARSRLRLMPSSDILILRLQGVEEVRSELPQAVSLCFGDGHEREGFARDRIAS